MKNLYGASTFAVNRIHAINLDEAFAVIDAWDKAVTAQLEDVARGMMTEAMITSLDNSAQWSGDFAAGWKVQVGEPDRSFQMGVFGKYYGLKGMDDAPFTRGDTPAMSYAFSNAKGRMDGFKLGQKIFLTNSAEHLTTYAWKIESNQIQFRPNNYGETVRITYDQMKMRFKTIDRATAQYLGQVKL
jgi:hypothetical protein